MSDMENCPVCKESAHTEGSSAYRDCRAAQLDQLLDRPDSWSFRPSAEETTIVLRGYAIAVELLDGKGLPEVQTVMNAVTLACREQDPAVDPVTLWANFQHDMPELLAERVNMHGHLIKRKPTDPVPELELIWQAVKVGNILDVNKKVYLDYEFSLVEVRLGGDVDDSFVADGIAAFVDLQAQLRAGFTVYDRMVNPDMTWTWSLRKPKVANVETVALIGADVVLAEVGGKDEAVHAGS